VSLAEIRVEVPRHRIVTGTVAGRVRSSAQRRRSLDVRTEDVGDVCRCGRRKIAD
jgi:hypothetical protein